jgi:putative ABC transport system substrate-binding protein
MRRRELVAILAGGAIPWLSAARAFAQVPARVYRVGLLGPLKGGPFDEPLMRGLARHGYALNKNLAIEQRPPPLLAELMASKPDVIIAGGYAAAVAVKQGTTLPAWCSRQAIPLALGWPTVWRVPAATLLGYPTYRWK